MSENRIYRFYGELAGWWPLVSPPQEYEEEAAFAATVLSSASIPVHEVQELGSGGGHNAMHLRARFAMTLVDLSEQILAATLSATITPPVAAPGGKGASAGDIRVLTAMGILVIGGSTGREGGFPDARVPEVPVLPGPGVSPWCRPTVAAGGGGSSGPPSARDASTSDSWAANARTVPRPVPRAGAVMFSASHAAPTAEYGPVWARFSRSSSVKLGERGDHRAREEENVQPRAIQRRASEQARASWRS